MSREHAHLAPRFRPATWLLELLAPPPLCYHISISSLEIHVNLFNTDLLSGFVPSADETTPVIRDTTNEQR